MMRNVAKTLVRCAAALPLAVAAVTAGCITTGEIATRGAAVDKLVADQHEPMYNCAPVELATAEASLAHARHETSEGRPHTAEGLLVRAEENARVAFERSRDRGCLGDRDGDGIPDRDDQCPDDPEDHDGFQDIDGCPEPDNDLDGVLDPVDRCPTQRGPPENGGCPVLDADGDGCLDKDDRCPTEWGPKENGCCPIKDTDKDGVPDNEDRCPNEPGPKENGGCPYKLIEITDKMIVLKEKVYFAFGKATIKKESHPLLNEVAQALKDHPTFTIRIEGHTDSVGKPASNKKLSQARADSVRKYLVSKGIAGSRLTAIGHGQDRPIDDNSTDAGRAINRRVEFHIVNK